MKRSLRSPFFLGLILVAALGIWFYHRWEVTRSVVFQGMPAVRKHMAPVNPNAATVRFPSPNVVTLPNGLRIFVIEDHRLP